MFSILRLFIFYSLHFDIIIYQLIDIGNYCWLLDVQNYKRRNDISGKKKKKKFKTMIGTKHLKQIFFSYIQKQSDFNFNMYYNVTKAKKENIINWFVAIFAKIKTLKKWQW